MTTATECETSPNANQFEVPLAVAPIPAPFLFRARSEGLDDLGQSVRQVIARGGEPCREVLRRAKAGERLILASFTPFTKAGPYKEYGPIFILARRYRRGGPPWLTAGGEIGD